MPQQKNTKDSKKSDKKKPGAVLPQPCDVLKPLLRMYKANCEATESAICKRLVRLLEKNIENNTFLVQFHIESNHDEGEGALPIKLEPLIKALRSQRYTFIKDLYIWTYPMCFETLSTLAVFISLPFYHIRKLELRDSLLTAELIRRLHTSFVHMRSLVHLNLDYNEFGCDGCWYLGEGLRDNKVLLSLSLCYCNLGPTSGVYLNTLITNSCISELYVDGNHLDCEGAAALIARTTEVAVQLQNMRSEAKQKQEESQNLKYQFRFENVTETTTLPESSKPDKAWMKPKKKKRKKKKKPPEPPKFGPYLQILSLADNDIDNLTNESERVVGLCMRTFARLISSSDVLKELDLGGNLIGTLAAMQLMEGLQQRQANKLPPIKLRTTHRLDGHVYSNLKSMVEGVKKKRKAKLKKK